MRTLLLFVGVALLGLWVAGCASDTGKPGTRVSGRAGVHLQTHELPRDVDGRPAAEVTIY